MRTHEFVQSNECELEQAHVRLRAVAAAREEQREACARQFDLARRAERPMSKREAYERVRATPLDSTPLAERVAELEKERDEIARIAQEWRDERDRAERERDALKARLVEATDDGSLSARIGAVREALGMSEFDSAAEVGPINDLKAQLDEARALNAELVEALGHLEGACAAVASWSEDCLDYGDERRVAARAVLAKAEKVRST